MTTSMGHCLSKNNNCNHGDFLVLEQELIAFFQSFHHRERYSLSQEQMWQFTRWYNIKQFDKIDLTSNEKAGIGNGTRSNKTTKAKLLFTIQYSSFGTGTFSRFKFKHNDSETRILDASNITLFTDIRERKNIARLLTHQKNRLERCEFLNTKLFTHIINITLLIDEYIGIVIKSFDIFI